MTIDQAISLAKKLIRQRRFADAANLYKSVLKQQPNNQVAKKGLRKLERSGQPLSDEPSTIELEKLIELLNNKQASTVVQHCHQLLKTFPRSVLLRNMLGTALQKAGEAKAAIEVLQSLIQEKPNFVEAYLNLGGALRDAGRLEDSAKVYEKAVLIDPKNPVAHFNLANVNKDFGAFQKAITGYQAAIDLLPDFSQAHRSLIALSAYKPDAEHRQQLERLWSKSSGGAKAEFGFALAKIEESDGNPESSFNYLKEANQLRKTELGYDIQHDKALFAQIRNCQIPTISSGSTRAIEADSMEADPSHIRPIFIVGMMRSGTSLVEQILASHSEVYGAGELDYWNQLVVPKLAFTQNQRQKNKSESDNVAFTIQDIQQLRHDYLSQVQDLMSSSVDSSHVFTDKMPLNFRWLGFLLSAFPEAKVLNVRREPMAVCWSIYKHYFAALGNAYAWDLEDIAAYYQLYVQLMDYWQERFPGRIQDVNYEALTREQETETRKLLEACDLDWQTDCLEFHKTKRIVATVSGSQVRKAMYQGSSDAWRVFEDHLEPLQNALSQRGLI